MYKFAAAAVALLAIGAGTYYLIGQRNAPSDEVDITTATGSPEVGLVGDGSGTYDVTVTFDGENFSPRELTVTEGTRVRFVNESDTPVWPASAVHPTHSIYPEKDPANCLGSSFDACKEMQRGEYFDFTFNHTGEWRYHDHVHAYKTGVVIVTE